MNRIVLILTPVAHLMPHPFGVSPMGAYALYAGAYVDRKIAWAVPLVPLLIANVLFGFYDFRVLALVYLGFSLSTLAGRLMLRDQRRLRHFGAAVTTGAMIFFVVSNFGVWLAGMYPPTVAGLLQCYINGLPWLGMALVADAGWSVLLFGTHTWLERRSYATSVA